MIGDVLSGQLRRQGAAGVVCDGAVRDVATLAGWADFAVFSRWITPRGPTGAESSDTGGAVRIGGVTVRPGDLILGDDDGLVALTPALARRLIDAAEAKLAREEEWQAGLAAGLGAARVFGL
jgi:regulator of RNase E activity RraA